MKKAFTLIETIIVVVIIGMLSAILMKTYIQMSQISFRVEQEKKVTQELLFVSQVLQNLADRNTLNYNKYVNQDLEFLKDHEWMTEVLYLSGLDGDISVYSEWEDCVDPADEFPNSDDLDYRPQCRIEMEQNGKKIQLTNPKKAYVSKVIFKIIPFASLDMYYNPDNSALCDTNYITCLHHPGFWVLGNLYNTNFWRQRTTNINIPLQQFFTLQ